MTIMILLTLALGVGILLAGLALGTFVYLTKNPPVINVSLPDLPPMVVNVDFSNVIPQPLVVQWQMLTPDQRPSGLAEEPMPMDVFAYCSQESEEHAMISRQKYARHLRNTLGNWDLALARLKQEDGI